MKTKAGNKRHEVRVFPMSENQCIWMKAGVVNFKLCENAFDCTTCAFDKAISREAVHKPTSLVSWREVMRGKPHSQRECRHMLTGRVQFKLCISNYECKTCEYDQLLDEEDLSAPACAIRVHKVAGFAVADGYYYHEGHSWARIENGGFVRLGIDDFALRLLGGPAEVYLPGIGSQLKKSEAGWSIHREEMSASVLSPINGIVMATNHNALRRPELAKRDPYGNGWLVVVHPHENLKKAVKGLMFERTADSWLKEEAQKLEEMVMKVYGVPLAATGGEIVQDIYGNLPHLKWEDLVHEFLHT